VVRFRKQREMKAHMRKANNSHGTLLRPKAGAGRVDVPRCALATEGPYPGLWNLRVSEDVLVVNIENLRSRKTNTITLRPLGRY
jgi:hypothetical protein